MSIFLTVKDYKGRQKKKMGFRFLSLILFSLFLSHSVLGREIALDSKLDLKTSERTVEDLITALKKSSLPADLEKAMPMMQARSSAHILRNPQAMLMVLKDPQFTKMVPEAKVLVEHPDIVVEAALKHDAAKLDPRTANAMKILALTQGMDRRNIPPTVSPEAAKVIEKAMNDAVHDINVLDDKIMEDTLKKVSPDRRFSEAFNSFMKATDLADTHSFRQTEIAGTSGRKLDPPSQWLKKLEKEKPMSPAELKESQLAQKMSQFIEAKNPYADPSKFPTADEFMKLGTDRDFDAKVKKEFNSRAQRLAAQAKSLGSEADGIAKVKESTSKVKAAVGEVSGGADGVAATTVKAAGSAGIVAKAGAVLEKEIVKPAAGLIKSSAVFSAGEAGIRYALNPDEGVVGALDKTIMASKVTCDTIGCANFVKDCKVALKLPESTSPESVLTHEHVDICLNSFFKKPLEEQALARRDPDFDKYLSQFSPGIINLSCNSENGKTVAIVETVKSKGVSEQHKIVYEQGSVLEKIEAANQDNFLDRIVFNGSAPQLLQHCNGPSSCKSYELANIKKLKIYPWLDNPQAMPGEKLAGQVPGDSFKWALKSQKLAERQAQSIRQCCDNKKCEQSLSSRAPSIRQSSDVHQANSVR